MKNKYLFLVIEKGQKELSEQTEESIKKSSTNKLDVKFIQGVDDIEDYSKLVTDKEKKDYTHVVIIPNGSTIISSYLDICQIYKEDNDTVILPLVILQTEKTKGVLNTCLWNSNLTVQLGELDFELAQKQIDMTLYGAIIPTKYFESKYFNADIKFYQHFYFLNKLTKEEVRVIGVPKTLLTTDVDLSYASIATDEKVKYFTMAKEVN